MDIEDSLRQELAQQDDKINSLMGEIGRWMDRAYKAEHLYLELKHIHKEDREEIERLRERLKESNAAARRFLKELGRDEELPVASNGPPALHTA